MTAVLCSSLDVCISRSLPIAKRSTARVDRATSNVNASNRGPSRTTAYFDGLFEHIRTSTAVRRIFTDRISHNNESRRAWPLSCLPTEIYAISQPPVKLRRASSDRYGAGGKLNLSSATSCLAIVAEPGSFRLAQCPSIVRCNLTPLERRPVPERLVVLPELCVRSGSLHDAVYAETPLSSRLFSPFGVS